MNKIWVGIYGILPKELKHFVGQSEIFRGIRYLLLKRHGVFKETNTYIDRVYGNTRVRFYFFASFNTAMKAKERGVESTLLRHSIELCSRFRNRQNDLTVLDIGANFGYLSLVWGQTVAKQGTVYAFEPNPHVFVSFHKSVVQNNMESIIKVQNTAVGSQIGSVTLYLNNTTSNVMQNVGTMTKSKMDSITIDMTSVDSFIKINELSRCDLIKIDVDGIELDILKGCITTIAEFKPIFIVETNDDLRIIDFFMERDYRILDMELKNYVAGTHLPINIFCVPKD